MNQLAVLALTSFKGKNYFSLSTPTEIGKVTLFIVYVYTIGRIRTFDLPNIYLSFYYIINIRWYQMKPTHAASPIQASEKHVDS